MVVRKYMEGLVMIAGGISGIYVRNINFKMSLLLFAAFMKFLLLEVYFNKYGAASLMQTESKRTNKAG